MGRPGERLRREAEVRLLGGDPCPCLLEAQEPAARWVTLTELLDRPATDVDVRATREEVLAEARTRTLTGRLPDWEADFEFPGHERSRSDPPAGGRRGDRRRRSFKARSAAADVWVMRWLLLLVPIVAFVGAWWRRRSRGARQRQLMLLCERAGLEFAPLDLHPDTAWLPFAMFGRARSGTENVVWDDHGGKDVYAFDFWYQDLADERSIGGRRRLTCAVVPIPATCPGLRVAPRDAAGDAAEELRGSEVRLELEEFDRRFLVKAEDERFAVAFLDQRMMEAFLALSHDVTAEVSEDVLLLSAPLMPPERVLSLFDAACRLRRRIPRVIQSLFPHRPGQGAFEHRWLRGRWSPDPTGADVSGRATSP